MELPTKVRIYSQILGLSGNPGTLMGIRDEGYYELHIPSKEGEVHVVLLPVAQTGLIVAEPEPRVEPLVGVER